ncbi:MAG: hypothetical protein K940chlam2_00823 [Chlamydiae bacterium]|nr:hypothetical protein [Chlamydiota bacterium]
MKAPQFSLIAKGVLIAACLVAAQRFCHKQTDGFSLMAISASRPYNKAFETRPLLPYEQEELKVALDQPYTYYGCGGQAFAFFSADGNYVIKFFKQRLFRPPHLLNLLPLPKLLFHYREKRNFIRRDKLARDFFSYRVSFVELQEQTGVLYTHLNRTKGHFDKLTITDKLGIRHRLEPDKFDFIVQKRAISVHDYIDSCRDSQEAGRAFASIFHLIKVRALKGYRDRDPNIRTNCGFLDGRAIKIDVGRFVPSEIMQTHEGWEGELNRIVAPFEEWVLQAHKEWHPIYLEKLQEARAL